ncbi:50S ribosomal protein L10 [Candidatus Micrarchaeota archaeon]|nr:50S ribosomal protein L10 [Candidatus Micrarchaeota archaeon]
MSKSERKNIIKKKKQVEELTNLLKEYNNSVLITLRNLPDSILQSMRKKLRGKALFKIYKTTVVKRAFENVGRPTEIFNHAEGEPIGVVLSNDMSPYQLSKFFNENKVNVAAKPGQVSPVDIMVPKMETNIPPGPALSELKVAGLKAAVQKGKIAILADKTIVKANEKVTDVVAKALQKLDIKPFTAGVTAIAGVDSEGIIFSKEVLSLDPSVFVGSISQGAEQGFSLSVNANIPTKSNIDLIISKAYSQAVALVLNKNIISKAFVNDIISKAYVQSMSVKKYAKL